MAYLIRPLNLMKEISKNAIIKKCNHQKHLGVILDSSLNFNTHIDQKIKKYNKLIGLLRRLKSRRKSSPECFTYNIQIFY